MRSRIVRRALRSGKLAGRDEHRAANSEREAADGAYAMRRNCETAHHVLAIGRGARSVQVLFI